jgi:hypothetical protein
MENDTIGEKYCNCDIYVAVGDSILLDNHKGIVVSVITKFTEEAMSFNCYDTGGILLEMEEYGLMLEPYGTHAYLERLS